MGTTLGTTLDSRPDLYTKETLNERIEEFFNPPTDSYIYITSLGGKPRGGDITPEYAKVLADLPPEKRQHSKWFVDYILRERAQPMDIACMIAYEHPIISQHYNADEVLQLFHDRMKEQRDYLVSIPPFRWHYRHYTLY